MDSKQVLATSGWLTFTSDGFRDAVLDRISTRQFAAGEPIYRVHDAPGGLWAIVDGEVQIEIAGPENAPSLAHFGAPGFWFGEGPLIHSTPRRIGVFATRRSKMATLPLVSCHAILAADPGAWRWIAVLSTMNLDLALGLSADLLLRDSRKRTAAMLLRLAGVRNGRFLPSMTAEIRVSHENLGKLVNLSRNALGPILQEFAASGLIDVHYKAIRIIDEAGLTALIRK